MLAAFNIQDWNNPAETRRVMKVLERISSETGAVALGVHHHGKDVTRGAAGSFALTAAADFVLSAFAETNTDGVVINRRLSVTKLRDAPTGWSCEFELTRSRLARTTKVRTSCRLSLTREQCLPDSGKSLTQEKTKPRLNRSRILFEAFDDAVNEKGVERAIADTGQTVRMARRSDVMGSFAPRNGLANLKPKSPDAQRQAFKRALRGAIEAGMVKEDGDWLWRDADAPL